MTLRSLAAFFLYVGATGFGGPVAVTNKMRRELVDKRNILAASDFREALTLAHLMPGPLAIQVAMYIGWRLRGVAGGSLAGICFVMPAFLMTIAIAWAYVAFRGIPQIDAAFHGVSAAVAALILFNATQLARGLLGKERALWILSAAALGLTLMNVREPVLIFLAAGCVNALIQSRKMPKKPGSAFLLIAALSAIAALAIIPGLPSLTTPETISMTPGLPAANVASRQPGLAEIFGFFFKAGALIFGSGLVIIPFMRDPLIHQLQWIDTKQFVDAVAVGFMTPGPALITVAFIGYLIHGLAGATVSSVGIFLPSWFYTLGAAPFYKRIIRIKSVDHIVGGISAAAVGAIAGSGIMIARDSVTDPPTIIIAAVSLFSLIRLGKIPEGILILLAAAAGILTYS